MGERLRAALDWLRGFLEGMMGAQAYDEAAFRRQMRDLLDPEASSVTVGARGGASPSVKPPPPNGGAESGPDAPYRGPGSPVQWEQQDREKGGKER